MSELGKHGLVAYSNLTVETVIQGEAMQHVDNFTVDYEPLNQHWVFYTNGMPAFSGGGYQFYSENKSLDIKPQSQIAGDMIIELENGFQLIGNMLACIAAEQPEILHQNGGQLWWDGKDRIKLHRLDQPGTEIERIGECGYQVISTVDVKPV